MEKNKTFLAALKGLLFGSSSDTQRETASRVTISNTQDFICSSHIRKSIMTTKASASILSTLSRPLSQRYTYLIENLSSVDLPQGGRLAEYCKYSWVCLPFKEFCVEIVSKVRHNYHERVAWITVVDAHDFLILGWFLLLSYCRWSLKRRKTE